MTTWKQRPLQDMAELACCGHKSLYDSGIGDGGNRDTLTLSAEFAIISDFADRSSVRPPLETAECMFKNLRLELSISWWIYPKERYHDFVTISKSPWNAA